MEEVRYKITELFFYFFQESLSPEAKAALEKSNAVKQDFASQVMKRLTGNPEKEDNQAETAAGNPAETAASPLPNGESTDQKIHSENAAEKEEAASKGVSSADQGIDRVFFSIQIIQFFWNLSLFCTLLHQN